MAASYTLTLTGAARAPSCFKAAMDGVSGTVLSGTPAIFINSGSTMFMPFATSGFSVWLISGLGNPIKTTGTSNGPGFLAVTPNSGGMNGTIGTGAVANILRVGVARMENIGGTPTGTAKITVGGNSTTYALSGLNVVAVGGATQKSN